MIIPRTIHLEAINCNNDNHNNDNDDKKTHAPIRTKGVREARAGVLGAITPLGHQIRTRWRGGEGNRKCRGDGQIAGKNVMNSFLYLVIKGDKSAEESPIASPISPRERLAAGVWKWIQEIALKVKCKKCSRVIEVRKWPVIEGRT